MQISDPPLKSEPSRFGDYSPQLNAFIDYAIYLSKTVSS